MTSAARRNAIQVGRWLRRPVQLALVGLALGAGSTVLLALLQTRQNARVAAAHFEVVAQATAELVRGRLAAYAYGLAGARGAVLAVGPEHIDRDRFRAYSASRDLVREFPGARGVGLIRRVAVNEQAGFLVRARQDGAPDFAIRQLTPHAGDRYVIQYIEPLDGNRQAVGLDIASESTRRIAAQTSMRTGAATLTAPITLLQAAGKPLQSFLLLLPIYLPQANRSTPEERESATVGWSFSPLVMDDVLADLDLHGEASLVLLDLDQENAGAFFTTPGHEQPAAAGLVRRIPIRIYGRTWQAELRATPAFVAGLQLFDPRIVGLSGIGIAGLLSFLVLLIAQNWRRGAQVRTEQARRAAIVDNTADAIIGETLDGIITDWNQGAEHLFGYAASEALGGVAADLILPKERFAEDAELRSAIARGELVASFDTTRQRADGVSIDVSVTAAPIVGADGQRLGLFKTIRDISVAKRAELEIKELNASLAQQVRERTTLLDAAERDLRSILDAVPSLVSYWDRDLRNRFANRAYQTWFGWDPATLPGKHLRALSGEGFAAILPRFEAALRGESLVFETTLPHPDGGLRHCVAHYLPDVVAGEVRGLYLIVYDVTVQTQAKVELAAALRDNEALLRTLDEHAIVSVAGRTGQITHVNERFCQISGYPRAELLGKDHRVINSGRHEKAFWVNAWRTLAAGKPWHGEVCNRAKNGSLYWVDSMITPFTGADGKIEKYISIRFDITKAKQTEEKLQQTNDRIAMAADAAGIGIWEFDVVNNTLVWDDWMYRLYGQRLGSREQPYTLWSTHLHPDDRERAERELFAAIGGERAFDTEFRIFHPDGQVRHLKAAARVVRDADGKATRMTGVNFDITERKNAELELIETSSLLRTVLESASEVSIIATDPQLMIRVFNGGAEHLLGYSATEVVNRATPTLIHDLDEVTARAKELSSLAGELVVGSAALIHPLALRQPREWTYIRKDGARVAVSLVVTAMHSQDGKLFGYLGVAHDVTRQKQYESSLRDALHNAELANRAKSQFLANMSHEIRTPMNAVLGLSYLLGQTPLDSEQAAFLSKIHVASRSLLALINDILDVSKIEAGELIIESVPFHLSALLTEVMDMAAVQASDKRVRFSSEVAGDLPDSLQGDATRLKQILTNLVANAVKFTAEGGVELRVRAEPGSGRSVTLRFEVEDTGIGIEPEAQARLFTPFAQADASTTRRFGGTGLGLSIVKRLTQLMGGEVGLSSMPGIGSLFWVTLPFEPAAEQAASRRPSTDLPRARALGGVRVLVVDDSEINLFVAQRILEHEGATVTIASTGQEAFERLQALPAGFDVVLMDVQMPEMDGHEATRRIRSELGLTRLPIIALTADARASERQEALAAGMDDFVSKPFEPRALVRSIRRLIDGDMTSQDLGLIPRSELIPASGTWPEVAGIDSAGVRERCCGDVELFQSLLTRLLDEFSETGLSNTLDSADALAHCAARMHKLCGAAGQLGALAVQELATRIEASCRNNEAGRAIALTRRLSVELRQLRLSAASARAVSLPGAEEALPARASEIEPERLAMVVGLLRAQDLAARSEVRAILPWARHALGPASFERLSEHLRDLRFGDAASLLEPYLPLLSAT